MSKNNIEGTQGLPECSSLATDSDASNSVRERSLSYRDSDLFPVEFDASESMAREEHSGSGRVNTQILPNVFGDASQEGVSLQQEINNQQQELSEDQDRHRSQIHATIVHETNIDGSIPLLPPLPPVPMESAPDELDQEIHQLYRTKSNRYHKEGRGPQLCGKCGQPRKGHMW